MSLRVESRYPNSRRYVLKMRGDQAAESTQLAGRLEHMVSGRQTDFATGRELLDLLAHDRDAASVPAENAP